MALAVAPGLIPFTLRLRCACFGEENCIKLSREPYAKECARNGHHQRRCTGHHRTFPVGIRPPCLPCALRSLGSANLMTTSIHSPYTNTREVRTGYGHVTTSYRISERETHLFNICGHNLTSVMDDLSSISSRWPQTDIIWSRTCMSHWQCIAMMALCS